ncbi:cell division protein ZipA [Vespertiliibacter pulmonis]|uniref:Cell division protein ZipA n=1 Tax=Vespertiliibacter pulmonis TaxID=1443036 RepID=A0A3N4VYZ0_9PAST|nr:cell division protein ZipA [Vespertiliibacter pulmonis]QLB20398.1 cell division protein ZipA [Vespertiliibacter pulmonis]RPE86385.1 cell division protein ZipA [Vespertiliibacter pulmonis]
METHILFFILAGLLIIVLIGATVWSARREKSRIFSNTFSTRPPSTPINSEQDNEIVPNFSNTSLNTPHSENNEQLTAHFAQSQREEIEQSISNIKISLPGEEQATFSGQLSAQHSTDVSAQPIRETATSEYSISTQQPLEQPQPTQNENVQSEESVSPNSIPQIITLYVVAAEGQQFYGENIVQHLENLGFQYGEYQIFHRHIDNASSPILFSVANMMQPGIFDLNNITQFTTVGLAFFMQLPSTGNDVVNLRLMIRTVESFAQSMGGFVLNEQHQLFDEQSRQAYLSQVSSN